MNSKHCPAYSTLITLLLVLTVAPLATFAQGRRAREDAPRREMRPARGDARDSPRPRLVLVLVADQFRADYFDRFGDLFVTNGFRRLMREGSLWTNVNYDHTPTNTAPGHATILTGTYPAENGIIGNEWFDRDRGRNTTSVADDSARLLGGDPTATGSSPRRLLASTLGDELRLKTQGRAKVIGISVKDRAAILPAGRHANAAYWFSAATGTFVSSNYYFNQLPPWVANFNSRRPADKYFNARWERLLPETEYLRRAGEDAPAWELRSEDGGEAAARASFPHIVTGGATTPNAAYYDALDTTPFANDLLADFALEAITNERLGADDDTDILTLSLSANDYVGHRFGPYSQEVMDITLRTDRLIADLLVRIERTVGANRTLVVFTADHGVAPTPEQAASLNLPGGRIRNNDILAAVKNAITARYNPSGKSPDPTADYIQAFINGNIYFNLSLLRRDGVDRAEIERVAGEAMLTVPGIIRYFTRTALIAGAAAPADPVARRVLHGFNSRRSGDVVVIQEPFKYISDSSQGATHSTPYSYDTRVPLLMAGAGVQADRIFEEAAAPSDIAPTLAALLNLQPPSSATGRILTEGLTRTDDERNVRKR